MKIGIIGFGYVGKAVYELMKPHYEVLIYDPYYKKTNTKDEINSCELAVVCVPTPDKSERCDTSIVEETVAWLETPLILIKSTVAPGTTERLRKETGKNIAFSPEYIGEGKYFLPPWKYLHPTDMRQHPFVIIGGERETTKKIVDILLTILGPNCKYFQTDSTSAELTKYMENTWAATKVTFSNEWFNICESFGSDYREVRELCLLDKRMERIHTAVFANKRGFNGKCLPKDLNGIVAATEEKGYIPTLLKEVKNSNKKFNSMNQ